MWVLCCVCRAFFTPKIFWQPGPIGPDKGEEPRRVGGNWTLCAPLQNSAYATCRYFVIHIWITFRSAGRIVLFDWLAVGGQCGRWKPSDLASKADVRRSMKFANFLGVSMKLLNHDTRVTCHVMIVTTKKWQAMRMPTLLSCFIFWLRNNVKSVGYTTCK